MLLPESAHWSTLINYIINVYLTQTLTVCILWNAHIEFDLSTLPAETPRIFLSIERLHLNESFEQDVYDFAALEAKLKRRTLEFDDLVMKLTAAIEHANCESFIAFQEDIPIFVRAFRKAVRYAASRLRRIKFLFAFYKNNMQSNLDYFDDILFVEQPNVLIIEAPFKGATKLELKTNKFVGSKRKHPEELISLGFYDASNQEFTLKQEIYADKLRNLQGREVTMATFDYKPIAVVDYERQPQFYDHTENNPQHSVFVDGTEVQTLIHFCWLYNCTIEVILAADSDWGMVYPNGTGTGLMGMTMDGRAEIAFAALYALDPDYIEATDFLGRSGVTCLVPRPVRKSSWAMLLRPFQLQLWLGVLFYLIVEILALFAIRHAEFSIETTERTTWQENLSFGYTTTLRLLISQSSNYVVSTPALRVLLLACFMIDIVIESVYNGGLASILTIPILTEAADTVERLARHGLIWVATSDYWTDSIATEENPDIHTIYKNFRAYTFEEMQNFAQYKDMAFAVERLIYGHFGNGGFLTPQALNRLMLMQEDIYFAYTMPFVTRLWPMLEKYNHLISVWHSAGFIKYWEWKSVADFVGTSQQKLTSGSNLADVDNGPVKLSMDNFVGLILVWVLGILISMICFALELSYYRKNNQLKDNN